MPHVPATASRIASYSKGTGELHSRMLLVEVREELNAFFPMHAIKILPRKPANGEPYVEVREMKVDELDLDYEPTREDLTIYLPKHTQYSDGINPNTAKSLFRDGDAEFAPIHVDEIEGIYNRLQALAVERAEEDAARAATRDPGGASRPSSTLIYWLGGINLLVVGLLVALYRRSQRRRVASS